MRYYETLYILNPNFEQAQVDNIIKEIDEHVSKLSSVINHRVWGKKRLAYPIDQHKYGIYIILQFETQTTSSLNGFDDFMKLNNSVLRYQTVRLDVRPQELEDEILDDSSDMIEELPQAEEIQGLIKETAQAPVENEKEETEQPSETVEEETSA
ncbi:MAG TPA: 30S ribosomal protein S6 [Candidatus Marinimicrobia bacterium]|jgi:small subunit ribosomal protein S6|nr:30S ribosomal protein S6 [Candidatus Neomarinimicrobiota bacterium]HBN45544.1 30S ribosomal protein S6 [Candidatus Neomarinimicrobiota bacterium]HJL74439.1 30S ribosomal protein S6 [Candidatus Neomarinimicrobiota bacterium]HJM69299.1 30S ribosomal protein S6 [Candidatus Neomarinimicrobiota bacterium]|tara:strand:+ start:36529 stop:36990 length:462 start_codon:yes stop_codon:yes gene_type:complete